MHTFYGGGMQNAECMLNLKIIQCALCSVKVAMYDLLYLMKESQKCFMGACIATHTKDR